MARRKWDQGISPGCCEAIPGLLHWHAILIPETKEKKKQERYLPDSNSERRDVTVIIGLGRGLADLSRHDADGFAGGLDPAEEFLDDGQGIRLQTVAGSAEGAGGVLELRHVGGDGPLQDMKISYWKHKDEKSYLQDIDDLQRLN